MLPTITLGTLTIDMYTVMMGAGMVAMIGHVLKRRKKVNLSVLQCVLFTVLMIAVGLVGANGLSYLQWGRFGSTDMFGTIFLVAAVMPLIGKLFGLKIAQAYDLSGLCLAIIYAFVKIGCTLTGCCEGIVLYVGNTYFQWPAQITVFIYETVLVLWLLRIEAYGTWQGALYPLFMLSYGLMRFFSDSLMYIPMKWFGLQPNQWYALISTIIGLIWLIIYKKRINQK